MSKIALISRNACVVWVVADSVGSAADQMSELAGQETKLGSLSKREMEDRLGGDFYDAYAIPMDMDPSAGDADRVIEVGELLGHFEAYSEDENAYEDS